YNVWKEYLASLGYTTFDGLINPSNIKFPQSRSRFFALSVLNYEGTKSNNVSIFEHIKEYRKNEFPKYPSLAKCLKTNYEGVKNIKYLLEALESTPNHTESRLKMFENERALTNGKGNPLRDSKNKFNYCSTITTKQDRWHNAGVVNFTRKMFEDGSNSTHRLITPRESFLLMGYKEKQFNRLEANNIPSAELYKMAGNSIIVPVLELIFETFILSDYLGE
ncbi:MAG: DNA cytosine methyltransferase, partial [Bacilli bacterium]